MCTTTSQYIENTILKDSFFSIQKKNCDEKKHKTPQKLSRFLIFVPTQVAIETIIKIKPWEPTKCKLH